MALVVVAWVELVELLDLPLAEVVEIRAR